MSIKVRRRRVSVSLMQFKYADEVPSPLAITIPRSQVYYIVYNASILHVVMVLTVSP